MQKLLHDDDLESGHWFTIPFSMVLIELRANPATGEPFF